MIPGHLAKAVDHLIDTVASAAAISIEQRFRVHFFHGLKNLFNIAGQLDFIDVIPRHADSQHGQELCVRVEALEREAKNPDSLGEHMLTMPIHGD